MTPCSDCPGEMGLECCVVFKSLKGILCGSTPFILPGSPPPLRIYWLYNRKTRRQALVSRRRRQKHLCLKSLQLKSLLTQVSIVRILSKACVCFKLPEIILYFKLVVEGSTPSRVDLWIPPAMVCWGLLAMCCLKVRQCNAVPDFDIVGLGTSLVCTMTFPIFISEENFLAFDFL